MTARKTATPKAEDVFKYVDVTQTVSFKVNTTKLLAHVLELVEDELENCGGDVELMDNIYVDVADFITKED